MFNPPVSEESVLQTCARIAKRGEFYHVNKYKYGEANKRKTCLRLKKEGKLLQGADHGKLLTFYRPEDVKTIDAAKAKHAQEMKRLHAKNVNWHLERADKSPANRNYHLKEAEKERLLSQ